MESLCEPELFLPPFSRLSSHPPVDCFALVSEVLCGFGILIMKSILSKSYLLAFRGKDAYPLQLDRPASGILSRIVCLLLHNDCGLRSIGLMTCCPEKQSVVWFSETIETPTSNRWKVGRQAASTLPGECLESFSTSFIAKPFSSDARRHGYACSRLCVPPVMRPTGTPCTHPRT